MSRTEAFLQFAPLQIEAETIQQALQQVISGLSSWAILWWEPDTGYWQGATHENRTPQTQFKPICRVDRHSQIAEQEPYRMVEARLFMADGYLHWVHPVGGTLCGVSATESVPPQSNVQAGIIIEDISIYLQRAGYKSQHLVRAGLDKNKVRVRQYVKYGLQGRQVIGWRILLPDSVAKVSLATTGSRS